MCNFNLIITRPNIINKKKTCNLSFFPFINIHSLKVNSLIKSIKQIKDIYAFIFISKNAIINVMPLIDKNWLFQKKIKCITIGPGSAFELRKFNIEKIFFPVCVSPDSYKVLKLNQLKSVKNKKVIIFKGNDGSNVLNNVLKKRKAIVYNVISYKRKASNFKNFKSFINTNKLNIILLTSVESIKNLFFFFVNKEKEKIPFLSYPVIVTSFKIKNMAIFLGFKNIFFSKSFKEDVILDVAYQVHKTLFSI